MQKVILDTDMANQVDDQFALTYLLNSLDKMELEAITIAPFSKLKTIEEGTQLSYEMTLKILELMDKREYQDKVFKGATCYMDQKYETNIAVKKIIEICLKNEKTTILAIGAITNIALAISFEPKIIDRMKVVWLGGNDLSFNTNSGTNFKDVKAVQKVFESGVDLTVIPCENVASNLITTLQELRLRMKETPINQFLIDRLLQCDREICEIGESKVLWDLSVIAYAIDESWFISERVSCPNILDDTAYELTEGNHEITFVKEINRDKVFGDLFDKL